MLVWVEVEQWAYLEDYLKAQPVVEYLIGRRHQEGSSVKWAKHQVKLASNKSDKMLVWTEVEQWACLEGCLEAQPVVENRTETRHRERNTMKWSRTDLRKRVCSSAAPPRKMVLTLS